MGSAGVATSGYLEYSVARMSVSDIREGARRFGQGAGGRALAMLAA